MEEPFEPFFETEAPDGLSLELPDVEATRRLGEVTAELLVESGGFIGLIGDLGTGKTTFVKGLVESLADDIYARSPTYTLLNEYRTVPKVIHVDLYRLGDIDELATIGYWDYVEESRSIVCVEWLDRIPGAWPQEGTVIVLQDAEPGRSVSIRSTHTDFIGSLREDYE